MPDHLVSVLLRCAELKEEDNQPAEDNTPLGRDEEVEEITADDYFIKNAEVQLLPMSFSGIRTTPHEQCQWMFQLTSSSPCRGIYQCASRVGSRCQRGRCSPVGTEQNRYAH